MTKKKATSTKRGPIEMTGAELGQVAGGNKMLASSRNPLELLASFGKIARTIGSIRSIAAAGSKDLAVARATRGAAESAGPLYCARQARGRERETLRRENGVTARCAERPFYRA